MRGWSHLDPILPPSKDWETVDWTVRNPLKNTSFGALPSPHRLTGAVIPVLPRIQRYSDGQGQGMTANGTGFVLPKANLSRKLQCLV